MNDPFGPIVGTVCLEDRVGWWVIACQKVLVKSGRKLRGIWNGAVEDEIYWCLVIIIKDKMSSYFQLRQSR